MLPDYDPTVGVKLWQVFELLAERAERSPYSGLCALLEDMYHDYAIEDELGALPISVAALWEVSDLLIEESVRLGRDVSRDCDEEDEGCDRTDEDEWQLNNYVWDKGDRARLEWVRDMAMQLKRENR